MPTEIQTPDASVALADLFKIQGSHQLLIDETVVPVVLIADVSRNVAAQNQAVLYRYLVQASAVANGKAVLFNGTVTDSGRDIIIDRVVCSAGTTGPWEFRFTTNAPINPIAASTATKLFRQMPQVGTPPGELFADDGPITGTSIFRVLSLASTNFDIAVDVRLGHQQAVSMQFAANNVTFLTTFFGRAVPRL